MNDGLDNYRKYDRMKGEHMSRKFVLERDYYEEGYNLYKKKTIQIRPGITVLVGCNGIGKTTLLHQLEYRLKKNKIPCLLFNNLHDGGHNAISSASFYNDFEFMAMAMGSSEGENIVLNICKLATKLRRFIETGEYQKDKLSEALENIFSKDENQEENVSNERWILLDAVDSGLSIDNVVDLKEQLFQTILKDNFGKDIYIVVSANEYEMARGEQCFDIYNGKYIQLKDYEEYRNLILASREWKEQRIEKAAST